MNPRAFFILGPVNMFIAIGAGAFGAHGLKAVLSPDMLAIWNTAVTYQVMHALGLLVVAVLLAKWPGKLLSTAGWLMFAGILFFSGSLYALALSGMRILGAVTPIGGVLFMAGWVLVTIWAMRQPSFRQ